MKRSVRTRIRQAAASAALLALASLTGCATVATRSQDLGVEVRPDAPPEYDVLVAQQHASEGQVPEAIAAYRRALEKDPDSAYLHRVLAETLARTNQLDEAQQHAERALALDPDDRSARTLLAQIYRVKREFPKAVALLVDEHEKPIDEEAAGTLYQVYLESDQPESALDVAKWMVANEDDSLRAHIFLANVYEKLGRPLDAEKALRAALKFAPNDLRIYGALARSMRERGDRKGEIAIYREVLASNPDDHATLVALADAQMSQDDLDGAIATLEQVEKRYPDDTRSIVRLGFLFYEARRMDEAAKRFEQALKVMPNEYEIAFFLGVADRRDNREDDALKVFATIPEDHKHYAEARTQMASIYENRGKFDLARKEVERALAAEPSRPLELYDAQLRAKAGDFKGAVAYLEGLLEKKPNDDELLYNLGVLYGEHDDTDQAIAYMRRALKINPDNASALNYIGYTWADHGENLDEAEKMITRAIELRPDDGYIVDSLGWVYYMRARPLVKSGRSEQAKGYIKRAIAELKRADEMTGGDPVISEHLGDTYLLLDDRKRALDLFLEAVQLGPRENEQPKLHEKLEALQRELE